jgi:hypothetical protein
MIRFSRSIVTVSALGTVLCLCCACSERAFAAGESIAGTVTDASSHIGIEGVEVCAWKISGSEAEQAQERCVFTGADGGYKIAPASEGTYKVEFWPRGGDLNYIAQFYNGKRYWGQADSVYGSGVPTEGIDAELQEGGEIEGRVVSEVGGAPIEGLLVCAARWSEDSEASCDSTDADGKYKVIGLEERDYLVEFLPEYNGLKFLSEYYGDAQISWMSEEVSVSLGEVTADVDAELEPASEIRGVVTSAASGVPLEGIVVCIAPPLDYSFYYFYDYGQCEKTNGAGEYAFGGLEAGQYKAMFSVELWEYVHQIPPLKPNPDGYPTVYWNEKPTWEEAELITLTAPTTAIANARLGPPAPAVGASPTPSAQSQPTSQPSKRRCRPGFTLKKIKGSRRCVRRPRKHRRHRHSHARPSRSFGSLEARSFRN